MSNPEYRDNSVVVHVTPNLNPVSILEMCETFSNSSRKVVMRIMSIGGRYMSYKKIGTLFNNNCEIASIHFIYQDSFVRVNHPSPFSYAVNNLNGYEFILLKGQIVTRQLRDRLKATAEKIRVPFALTLGRSNG